MFTEKHYRTTINGKKPVKWSGNLPVNYGNTKTTKGKDGIYSTDVTQGCTNRCVGCYAASLSMITCKNFEWVKNVRLFGTPKGKPFIWTAGQKSLPKEILESDIGINVSLDPMREKAFFLNSLRTILCLSPRRVLIGLKLYPNNPVSLKRNLLVANMLRSMGYKGIFHMVMRIRDKKTANKLNCALYPKGKKEIFYKSFADKRLGLACGSKGNGTCEDCRFCYSYHKAKYRVGTMSDPLLRKEHLVKEFKRKGWISSGDSLKKS